MFVHPLLNNATLVGHAFEAILHVKNCILGGTCNDQTVSQNLEFSDRQSQKSDGEAQAINFNWQER